MPKFPKLSGKSAIASSIRWRFQAPGHSIPTVLGPEPPPITVVTPADWYSSSCWTESKWGWMSISPGVTMRPSTDRMSVFGPTISPGVMSIVSGLPDFPMPTNLPSSTPMSHLTTPWNGSIKTALVTTMSRAPSLRLKRDTWPMPSRIVLPPPKTSSSP